MKVLVCGGRNYKDVGKVFRILNKILAAYPDMSIVHGDCPTGADAFADAWAKHYLVNCKPYPADWLHLGKPAGPIRNKKMLKESKPDVVVAFMSIPLGPGTKNMLALARAEQKKRLLEIVEI